MSDLDRRIAEQEQAAALALRKLCGEQDALVNLLMALVRRSGGQAFVTKAELDALENCVITSRATEGPNGVHLSVRREAAV